MTFQGFPRETFAFLEGLKANNEKAWFDAHRADYDRYFRDVAFDLIAALSGLMSNLTPALCAEPRVNGSLKRINRDVRFSKDKTPYNARMHLVFWSGDHPNRSPAMHVVIGPERMGFGAGTFGLSPGDLTRMRRRICDPNDRAGLIAAQAYAEAIGCEWDAPDLKRLPSGFEADGDWEHLLRRKSFVMRTLDDPALPDWIRTPDCADRIMDLTRACLPLIAWLAGAD